MSRRSLILAAVLAGPTPAVAAPELLHRGSTVLDLRTLGGDNDRFAEPGESFDLALRLGNEGDIGARGITATLSSSDPALVVAATPASVSFPDLAIDAFGDSAQPYFRLTAQASLPCGRAVTLELRLDYSDDLGNPFAVRIPLLLLVGEQSELAHEDFDTGPGGWKRDLASTGSGGQWVNAAPEPYNVGSDPAQPGRDVTYPDVSCFYTGQNTDNVDGGNQILLSRTYDLSGRSNVWLSWFRWFYTDDPAAADSLEMRISSDGGGSWTTVERIVDRQNAWIPVAYRIDTLVTLGSNVVLQVVAEDGGAASTAEAAVDELSILALDCVVDPPEAGLSSSNPLIDDAIDPLCSDRDGRGDAGETIDFSVTVRNGGNDAARNTRATLVTPLPPQLTLLGANPVLLGTLADNGGTAVATFRLLVAGTTACKAAAALSVTVAADPPSTGGTRSYPLVLEEDVDQPTLVWFDDFDSGLADWTVIPYGLNDDWGPGVQTENCAKIPGTPPTPALKFWYTGSTGGPTDCQVTPYGLDDDSAIRSPRIDTGYTRPLLLELNWAQLLTMTPGEADYAEAWIDHDDDGVFTRLARYEGPVTTNGDTLDVAGIDLQNNPDMADLTASSRFVAIEFRFRSDSSDGNSAGKPLALGWILDNVELSWTDAGGRTCDANLCSSCQSNPDIVASRTQACTGERITLDGSGSILSGCPAPGVMVFSWFRNGAPWTTGVSSIDVTEAVAGSYDYRLELSCSTLPTCAASTTQRLVIVDCPNCAASAQLAAAPDEACAGAVVLLDAGASTVNNCPAPGVRQFQWYRNGNPVGTGVTYLATETVAATYDYRVDVSCSTDPACRSQATHSIRFKPDGAPFAVGNTLKARQQRPDVELSWLDTQALAVSWNVYRATSRTAAPSIVGNVAATAWTDAGGLAAPPGHYLYSVRALSCSGIVGP